MRQTLMEPMIGGMDPELSSSTLIPRGGKGRGGEPPATHSWLSNTLEGEAINNEYHSVN